MHPRAMSSSCHEKEDVLVLAGPHLHMGTSFVILCKVCDGKMLMAEELPRKQSRWSCSIVRRTMVMCRRRKSWNWSKFEVFCILVMVEYGS